MDEELKDALERAAVKRWRWTNAEKAKSLHIAWRQMKRMCEQHSQPQSYHDDMDYWDRKRLREVLPDEFIWVLRNCGTWLLIPPDKEKGGAVVIVEQSKPGSYDNPHLFHWDGELLSPITQQEAIDVLRSDWMLQYEEEMEVLTALDVTYRKAQREAKEHADMLVDRIWEARGCTP